MCKIASNFVIPNSYDKMKKTLMRGARCQSSLQFAQLVHRLEEVNLVLPYLITSQCTMFKNMSEENKLQLFNSFPTKLSEEELFEGTVTSLPGDVRNIFNQKKTDDLTEQLQSSKAQMIAYFMELMKKRGK